MKWRIVISLTQLSVSVLCSFDPVTLTGLYAVVYLVSLTTYVSLSLSLSLSFSVLHRYTFFSNGTVTVILFTALSFCSIFFPEEKSYRWLIRMIVKPVTVSYISTYTYQSNQHNVFACYSTTSMSLKDFFFSNTLIIFTIDIRECSKISGTYIPNQGFDSIRISIL